MGVNIYDNVYFRIAIQGLLNEKMQKFWDKFAKKNLIVFVQFFCKFSQNLQLHALFARYAKICNCREYAHHKYSCN